MKGKYMYEGVFKIFRTGLLERELHMVQLSATRCSCIAVLWFSLVSFAAITLCVASQQVFNREYPKVPGLAAIVRTANGTALCY
jgi:hypothetical protein